eukprot:2961371-Heterocapsa_arctica.AAC.1
MVLVGAVPVHGAMGLRERGRRRANPIGLSRPSSWQPSWLRASGGTVNQGNAHVVEGFMSTRFPLCAVLIKLSRQLEERSLSLALGWRPRGEKYRSR